MKLIQISKSAPLSVQIDGINRNFQSLAQEIISIRTVLDSNTIMLKKLKYKMDKDIGANAEIYSKTRGEM